MKKILSLLLATCMLLSFAACAKTPAETTPGDGTQPSENTEPKILKIGEKMDDVGNLNALLTTYNEIFELSENVFDTLISKNPATLELEPNLIEDFPEVSEDGKIFTFKLKQGIKFHDGSDMTSADVEYSFNRFFNPKYGNLNSWMANMIKGSQDMIDGKAAKLDAFKVIDDYSFSIELEYGYTAFLAVLAVPPLGIVPMEACEAAGDRWGIDTTIGSGPFKIDTFSPNIELNLVANKEYHRNVPKLDGVQILNMDASTALIEWEAGNIDFCGVGVDLVDSYLDNPDFKENVKFQEYIGINTLILNQKIAPFDNAKVREAIGLATDLSAICDGYFKGHIKPAKSVLPKGIPGYDDALPTMEYNPEKAKALLAEAGYPDGIEITATTTETSNFLPVYQVMQEFYKKAGITMNIEKVDAAGWFDKRSTGNVQFYILNWFADFVDPDNFMYSLFHSSVSDFFSIGLKDTNWDKRLENGRVLPAEEKQKYYADAEKWLTREQFVNFPVYCPAGYYLVSDRVEGMFIKFDSLKSFATADIVK